MALRTAALALASAALLGGCSSYYDDYGYGYGSVSVGIGGYYDDPYWGYFQPNPYWGWYNDYYYPGTGIYVYDRYRRPHRWNDYQRRYWTDRRSYWERRPDWDRRQWRDNWYDFRRDRRDDRRRRR